MRTTRASPLAEPAMSTEETSSATAPEATGAIPRRVPLQQRWEALRSILRHTRDESLRVLALEQETIRAWDAFLTSDPDAAAISAAWANGIEKRRAELEAVDALRAACEERKKAAAQTSQSHFGAERF